MPKEDVPFHLLKYIFQQQITVLISVLKCSLNYRRYYFIFIRSTTMQMNSISQALDRAKHILIHQETQCQANTRSPFYDTASLSQQVIFISGESFSYTAYTKQHPHLFVSIFCSWVFETLFSKIGSLCLGKFLNSSLLHCWMRFGFGCYEECTHGHMLMQKCCCSKPPQVISVVCFN